MATITADDVRHPLHIELSKALRDHVARELVARGIEPPNEKQLDFDRAGRRVDAVKRIRVIVCRHISKSIPRCELDEHDAEQNRIDFGRGYAWSHGRCHQVLAGDLDCAIAAHLRGEPEGDADQENEGTQSEDDLAWREISVAYHHRHSRALHAAGQCAQPEKPRSPIAPNVGVRS